MAKGAAVAWGAYTVSGHEKGRKRFYRRLERLLGDLGPGATGEGEFSENEILLRLLSSL